MYYTCTITLLTYSFSYFCKSFTFKFSLITYAENFNHSESNYKKQNPIETELLLPASNVIVYMKCLTSIMNTGILVVSTCVYMLTEKQIAGECAVTRMDLMHDFVV